MAIDYLESLGGISREVQKAFFQSINGLLRKTPVLLVWPVTNLGDAQSLLTQASDVAGTLFDKQLPILRFQGPKHAHYPSIAKNTIGVFNNQSLLQDYLLTEAELDALRDALVADKDSPSTIRSYLDRLQGLYQEKSGQLAEIMTRLPRPNEVWSIFCHPEAEDVVGNFATKGEHVASAWTAYHSKLWEYVPNTQRQSKWNNPTRLQYAIGGAFTARILFMSPQALVSACAAYGGPKVQALQLGVPSKWSEKSTAVKHMLTTALCRQLLGDPPSKGKTKGGPSAAARGKAEVPFVAVNAFVTGTGNDRHVNAAVAACLQDTLPSSYAVVAEKPHPWIPSLSPDIRIDTPDGRQVCLEFCYTNNRRPSAVADYVLDKLATYMGQLDVYVSQPPPSRM